MHHLIKLKNILPAPFLFSSCHSPDLYLPSMPPNDNFGWIRCKNEYQRVVFFPTTKQCIIFYFTVTSYLLQLFRPLMYTCDQRNKNKVLVNVERNAKVL
ncbi:hypothetical protein L218DRAFT_55669 [Marasmius fiardii PR-910]|nr:hypothetical protein L218DRAFT_55669 [Marasmius fiardii PR-910]